MMWLLSRLLIENTAQIRQAPWASRGLLPVPSEPTVLAMAGMSCRAWEDELRFQEAVRPARVSFPGSQGHAPCFFFLCGLLEFSLNQILKTASCCRRPMVLETGSHHKNPTGARCPWPSQRLIMWLVVSPFTLLWQEGKHRMMASFRVELYFLNAADRKESFYTMQCQQTERRTIVIPECSMLQMYTFWEAGLYGKGIY